MDIENFIIGFIEYYKVIILRLADDGNTEHKKQLLRNYKKTLNVTHLNIIILQKDKTLEAWWSLTRLCRNHPEFSYNYLKRLKYPFKYKNWTFRKIPFN